MKYFLIAIAGGLIAFFAAQFFGFLAGTYAASYERTYRRRAIKLFGDKGEQDEFLILSGNADLVAEMYRFVVATSARAEEIAVEPPVASKTEGIQLDDRQEEDEQNTNRPGRA